MTLHVALTYHLGGKVPTGVPEDYYAEYDKKTTVGALRKALEAGGRKVSLLHADLEAYGALLRIKPDIVFNIAEGLNGESRESYIPLICEKLRIPYTGSG